MIRRVCKPLHKRPSVTSKLLMPQYLAPRTYLHLHNRWPCGGRCCQLVNFLYLACIFFHLQSQHRSTFTSLRLSHLCFLSDEASLTPTVLYPSYKTSYDWIRPSQTIPNNLKIFNLTILSIRYHLEFYKMAIINKTRNELLERV